MYVRPISTRLLSGMLTPAMRAIFLLALTLLVSRVLADHEDPSVATDDLALLAHRLDRRSYLHDPFRACNPDEEALETGAVAATIPRSGLLHADGPLDLSATAEYSAVFRSLVSPASTPDSAPGGMRRRAGSPPLWRSPRRRRRPGG